MLPQFIQCHTVESQPRGVMGFFEVKGIKANSCFTYKQSRLTLTNLIKLLSKLAEWQTAELAYQLFLLLLALILNGSVEIQNEEHKRHYCWKAQNCGARRN